MDAMLPTELWLQIHAFATASMSPLALANTITFAPRYQDLSNPFKHIKLFRRVVKSFSLVSRAWNRLVVELLFQSVVVDDDFPTVLEGFLKERPHLAHLVRAVYFSDCRFDYNTAVLRLCPNIEVIVLLEDVTRPALPIAAFDPATHLLPNSLPQLRHLYWTEGSLSTGLLLPLLLASPQLHMLFAAESSFARYQRPALQLSSAKVILKRLSIGDVIGHRHMMRAVLGLNLSALTTLECPPSLIKQAGFPERLPQLHTLHLSAFSGPIPFSIIFARFPALKDLAYGVWDQFTPLAPGPSSDSDLDLAGIARQPLLVRLTSAISLRVMKKWDSIEDHFGLLLDVRFPPPQRVVLYGAWDVIINDPRFLGIRTALRERGFVLEHPEGNVINGE
uniref:F-box domain-containing protein n=1 Tax=Mycena chlorophos TaxID=658473 RepID=A0ABQ0LIS8_MYCCL|nr:predicted protein [Mycena chlorophos]